MNIVTTADDFGYSEDTVAATIEALTDGLVKNASIMPAAPCGEYAAVWAARNPQYCYGVHLTLARDGPECPVAEGSGGSTITDESGRFFPGRQAQARALLGRFSTDDVVAEFEAQIGFVRDHGVTLDYVDSHKHLHKYPTVAAALGKVLPRFGVRKVRRTKDTSPTPLYTSPTYWLGRVVGQRWLREWATTDYFYMSTGPSDLDFPAALMKRPVGTIEIGAHPGTADEWRRNELRALVDFAAYANDFEYRTLSWRDLDPKDVV